MDPFTGYSDELLERMGALGDLFRRADRSISAAADSRQRETEHELQRVIGAG